MSELSDLAVVTAMLLYIAAFVAHTVEWASARSATATPLRRPRSERRLISTGSRSGAAGRSGLIFDGSGDEDAGQGDGADREGSDGSRDATGVESRSQHRIDLSGRIGIALTVIATVSNLAGVVLRGVAADRPPLANMYEFTISAVALIMVGYLVMALRFGMRWLGLPTTLLAAIASGLAVEVFYVAVAAMVPALHSVWFAIHISAAAVAGAAFNVGALVSILFLIRQRMERRGQIRGYLTRIPDARALDTVAYRLHAFAFPVWTFAVAAGSVWAQYAWGRFWGWDPKETWALITWVVYACYLHARLTAGWKGSRAVAIALVGVATFWFNFIGINLLVSGLHSYAGV